MLHEWMYLTIINSLTSFLLLPYWTLISRFHSGPVPVLGSNRGSPPAYIRIYWAIALLLGKMYSHQAFQKAIHRRLSIPKSTLTWDYFLFRNFPTIAIPPTITASYVTLKYVFWFAGNPVYCVSAVLLWFPIIGGGRFPSLELMLFSHRQTHVGALSVSLYLSQFPDE